MKAALIVLLLAARASADPRDDVDALLARTIAAVATSDQAALEKAVDPYAILILPKTAPTKLQHGPISIAVDETKKRAWFHGRLEAWQVTGMAVDNGGWKIVGLMIAAVHPDPARQQMRANYASLAPRSGDAVTNRLLESWVVHGVLSDHAQSTAIAFGPRGKSSRKLVEAWRLKMVSTEAIRSGSIAFAKAQVLWPISDQDAAAMTLGAILVDGRWVVLGLAGDSD